MTDEPLDCGHTQAEHEAMAREKIARLEQGDIAPIMQDLTQNNLIRAMQAGALEILVRAGSLEEAQQYWEMFHEDVMATLFPANGEDSRDPESYKAALEIRADYHKDIELAKFKQEAEEELRILTEQHGVLPETPKAAGTPDDQWPGQYL